MMIQTTRFGPVQVDADRLIYFPDGPVGFPAAKRFALISTGEQSSFYWLQAVEDESLAFVVTDPRLFVPDYQVTVRPEERSRLSADDGQPLQLFVIVNKVDHVLTGNLQGPIVVNPANRTAMQMVLSEKRYTTRHPLVQLPARDRDMSRTA
ncbi:MAG: Flagellar assembly factor FliW [Phycisphaerae bacterium]|nr:Flagellar assembly factor FliW [Phycisphaerae bacterium]